MSVLLEPDPEAGVHRLVIAAGVTNRLRDVTDATNKALRLRPGHRLAAGVGRQLAFGGETLAFNVTDPRRDYCRIAARVEPCSVATQPAFTVGDLALSSVETRRLRLVEFR
jgi:hypothetical protein